MRVNHTDIYMTRGDSETFNVSLFDKELDLPRQLIEGEDTVYFTVKTSTQTETKIIDKVVTNFNDDGEAIINIDHNDTKDLKYGEYVYDVQVIMNGLVKTVIKPSKFVIEEEVTYEY